jgi:hypothetical protein
MNDVLNDIEILESYEKRAALYSLQKLIDEKKNIVETFEKEMAPKDG